MIIAKETCDKVRACIEDAKMSRDEIADQLGLQGHVVYLALAQIKAHHRQCRDTTYWSMRPGLLVFRQSHGTDAAERADLLQAWR